MTWQYFFFDTAPGYFLEALPVALLGGLLAYCRQRRRFPFRSRGEAVIAALFICYLAGLLCLTLFLDLLKIGYYVLFYHRNSGISIRWFQFVYDWDLTLFSAFDRENLGNLLLFLPFGILWPLYDRQAGWLRTVGAGVLTTVSIELLQPVFGRSFDINDIFLNTLGVFLSATVFFLARSLWQNR